MLYQLHFKWTVSRGRDTYGYNICTLLVDGRKVGRCMGGGYDMQGTCFAQWLENAFQDKLQVLFAADLAKYANENYTAIHKYYGARIVKRDNKPVIVLDGGCGFSSMERIANAIGLKIVWNPANSKLRNDSYYVAISE